MTTPTTSPMRKLRDASTSDITAEMLMRSTHNTRQGSLATVDSFEGSIEAIRREWPEHLTRDADPSAELSAKRDAVLSLQSKDREALIRKTIIAAVVVGVGLVTIFV